MNSQMENENQDFYIALAKFVPVASQLLLETHSAIILIDKMGYDKKTNSYILSLEIKELDIDEEEGNSFEHLGIVDLGFSLDYRFASQHFSKFIFNKVSQHIEAMNLREEIDRERKTLNMYHAEWLRHKQQADNYDSKINEKRKRISILETRINALKPVGFVK